MRSNSAQMFVIFLALVGTCMVALYIPFVLSGDRLETRPDIVLTPRFTATATPLDRALTREAFALRFFTPTNSPAALPIVTPIPAPTTSKTVAFPIIAFGTIPSTAPGTGVVVFVPNTGARRTVHRPEEQPPISASSTPRPPTPTAFKTPTKQATATPAPTDTPASTSTPRPPTPRPTLTPRPTSTTTLPPTSTSIPPTATPEPPTVEPPTVESPTIEPPTIEPPTIEPPTIEPPTIEPPTIEPPTEQPTDPPQPADTPIPT